MTKALFAVSFLALTSVAMAAPAAEAPAARAELQQVSATLETPAAGGNLSQAPEANQAPEIKKVSGTVIEGTSGNQGKTAEITSEGKETPKH